MSEFKKGSFIGIPCRAVKVAFDDEMFIRFDTLKGEMSGFVLKHDLRKVEGNWQVRGVVEGVKKDHLDAWVWGEFFQTAGLVKLKKDDAVAV